MDGAVRLFRSWLELLVGSDVIVVLKKVEGCQGASNTNRETHQAKQEHVVDCDVVVKY